MIEFCDVTFAYPGTAPGIDALSGLSLTVEPGAILAVAGANGSGKSTLARLCDGLLLPTSGNVVVDGMDTSDEHLLWDVRSRVGMVFQDPDDQIVGTVVEEDVAFGPENLGVDPVELRARVTRALAAVGLEGSERREPHLLSEGQKQRVAIAGALALGPAYLVLDEPTAMLDPVGRRAVLDVIDALAHRGGHGVVHVSHDARGIARADRVLVLDGGRAIFHGDPDELLADPVMMAAAGLSLGAMGRLSEALRASGLAVPPRAYDAESVVAALWP